MDDDTLRRGRPTSHVVFGEGLAILAGDALLTEAFALMAREPGDPVLARAKVAARSRIVAEAAGPCGMVGGQAIDLEAAGSGSTFDGDGLRAMHARKTGALIRASAAAGAVMAGATDAQLAGHRTVRDRARTRLSDRGRHPRRRGGVARARQDRRQGRRRWQADLPGALRSRRVAPDGGRLRRARARCAGAARQVSISATAICRPLRAGSPAAPTDAVKKAASRLDAALVARGLAASRERARALILAGLVRVNGEVVSKAGSPVDPTRRHHADRAGPSLRRTRRRQAGARARRLRHRRPGRARLDVGASTGGFTDVLLRRGAARVVALDVGHGQLDWRLRNDPRVMSWSASTRACSRPISCPKTRGASTVVTMDLSFISCEQVLPAIAPLLAPEATWSSS